VKRVVLCLNIVALLAGASCNNYTAPAGTSRAITVQQLAGTRTVRTVEGVKGTLTLTADGACRLAPYGGGLPMAGTWTLDGNTVAVSLATMTLSGWVIDSADGPAGFAIYGGDGDPDLYAVWY